MKQFLLIILISPLLVFSQDISESNIFIDKRDGKDYKYVKIENQIWMAENLEYKHESFSLNYYNKYQGQMEGLAIYGYFYEYEIINEVCPFGWKIPSQSDWDILSSNLGGWSSAGLILKSKSNVSNSRPF